MTTRAQETHGPGDITTYYAYYNPQKHTFWAVLCSHTSAYRLTLQSTSEHITRETPAYALKTGQAQAIAHRYMHTVCRV